MKRNFDIEAVARAIEADAGETLPDIRTALAEVKAGNVGRITTPEQILLRQARAKTGLTQLEFAKRIDTPAATLRDWEQGRFAPPGGANSARKSRKARVRAGMNLRVGSAA